MKRVVKVGLALLLIISVVSLGIIGCAKEEAANQARNLVHVFFLTSFVEGKLLR